MHSEQTCILLTPLTQPSPTPPSAFFPSLLSLHFLAPSPDVPVNPGSATLWLEGCQSCDITTLWFPFKDWPCGGFGVNPLALGCRFRSPAHSLAGLADCLLKDHFVLPHKGYTMGQGFLRSSSSICSSLFHEGTPAASQRPPPPTCCQGVGCPLASGLDPVVPSSHSPVTETQGHMLIVRLLCARRSVCMGKQGSHMILDLAELIA